MTQLSREEIDHLAKLSRLTLSTTEKASFAKQLPQILDFVDQLNGVSEHGLKSHDQIVSLAHLRPDKPTNTSLSLDQLKALAPDWRDDQVVVPAVFGEADEN